MADVNGVSGVTNVEGSADMVLQEVDVEQKIGGGFKDLVMLCLGF